MTLLLVFFCLAIIVSFACSLWESVLLSITPSYVTHTTAEGTATGRLLTEFKRDIDRPLSAILTLNLGPLVWMSQTITRYLKKDKGAPVFSRAEFLAMTEMGRAEGQLDEREAAVINNLLSLNRLRVYDVMTPRPVVIGALGTGDGHRTLAELEREALFIPDTLSLAGALSQLLERRQQLAIVVDEYGVTAGVITVEDILETLLGIEIMDEKDSVADLQRLARERWEARRGRLFDEG